MSVVSTVGDLSTRFVNDKQFDALDEFAKSLHQDDRQALEAISKKNRKLLEWDRERLPELKRFLRGSAAANGISVLLSIVLLSLVYLFQ